MKNTFNFTGEAHVILYRIPYNWISFISFSKFPLYSCQFQKWWMANNHRQYVILVWQAIYFTTNTINSIRYQWNMILSKCANCVNELQTRIDRYKSNRRSAAQFGLSYVLYGFSYCMRHLRQVRCHQFHRYWYWSSLIASSWLRASFWRTKLKWVCCAECTQST